MRDCLLCGQEFTSQTSFSQILLVKREEAGLCPLCWQAFERIGSEHCPSCYKKGETALCSDCHYWQARAKQVHHRSVFHYNQAMKDYFSRYKFQGDYLLRQVFAPIFRQELRFFNNYQIVPIPLSPAGWQKRGFNQVTGFLEAAGLPYQELLGKKEGPAQSSKTRQERLASPQSFFLLDGAQPRERILLVDDIYTTGSSLQRAKEVLYENGVKEIMTFSLAR